MNLSHENIIIVSRHRGTIEWLYNHNIIAPVKPLVKAEDVKNKIVIGALPIYLAAEAEMIVNLEYKNFDRNYLGKDLTAEDIDKFGGYLVGYKISKTEVSIIPTQFTTRPCQPTQILSS